MSTPFDEYDFTLDEIEEAPVLCQGQADDLKWDDGTTRIWLCRCDVTDGMPYNDAITVERLIGGRWAETGMAPADRWHNSIDDIEAGDA